MPPPPKAEAAAKDAKAEAAPAAAPAPVAPAPRGGLKAWLPAIATVLLAPVATWATVEFVLLPRLQKKISAAPAAEHDTAKPEAPAESGGHGSKKGKEGKEGGSTGVGFEFSNQVVNLNGTMGTRYLKTNVHVVGADPNLKTQFETAKVRLTDITQSVLSSLTLADIEEPGAKNVIRSKLVLAYNQALGRKVVDDVFLTDFVVQ